MPNPYSYFGVEDPYKVTSPAVPGPFGEVGAPVAATAAPAAAPAPAPPPDGGTQPNLAGAVTAAAKKGKKKKGTGYEALQETVNYYTQQGDTTKAAAWQAKLDKFLADNPGYDTSGYDVNAFDEYEDYAPGQTGGYENAMMQKYRDYLDRQVGAGKDINIDKAMNRRRVRLHKDLEANMKLQGQRELMPSLDAAQQRVDEMLQQEAVSASQEAAMRSKVSAQVKIAEAQRAAKIGATLGFGNMSNSPAAASLAADAAEDADRMVISTLRDLDLQTRALNRESSRMDADLASRIALMRWNVMNGDSKSLIGMRGDIASMIDAMYSRDISLELARKSLEASDDSGFSSWGGAAGQLLGGVGSVMSGGADMGLFSMAGQKAGSTLDE